MAGRPPIVGLQVTITDETLLSLSDSTRVTFHEQDIKGGRYYLAGAELVGVAQDYLDSLLERAVTAWRWGTPEEVRRAVLAVQLDARRHKKAHERS